MREGEGRERGGWKEGRRREGEEGMGEKEGDWMSESHVMNLIISRVLNTWTLPLHPPISGFFLMSLFCQSVCFAWF